MALQLVGQNRPVAAYGLSRLWPVNGIYDPPSLKDALAFCGNIVCPIPLTRDGLTVAANSPKDDLTIENFKAYLRPGQRLFGGQLGPVLETCEKKGVPALTLWNPMKWP
jgi:hypothetical protein